MDIRCDIPQDWFCELERTDYPNEKELNCIDSGLYMSECELIGNMGLFLYEDKNGNYYMEMVVREPIGDYGSHSVTYWYKCEEQYKENVKEILEVIK